MSMWYEKSGEDMDVVIATKVSVARNVKGFNFSPKISTAESDSLLDMVSAVIDKNKLMNHWSVRQAKENKEEANLLTPETQIFENGMNAITQPDHKGIYYNADASLSVLIGDREHITIRSMSAGHDKCTYARAEQLASELEGKLDMAFSEKYGFLTSDVRLTGTGLKISYVVAIPATVNNNGGLAALRQRVAQYYWEIRPFAEQGELADSNIYVVTNVSTLGVAEEDVESRGEMLIGDIIKFERKLREELAKKKKPQMADLCGRSYGLLRYSGSMSRKEAVDALNWIRIYKDFDDSGDFKLSWEAINKLTQMMCWEPQQNGLKLRPDNLAAVRSRKIKEILKGDD